MQKGFVQLIVVGIAALVLVGAGALYLGKDSLLVAQLRYSPTVRSIKTAFLTKGSAEYCQQFGPGDCPKQYCELSGPSCPMCLNIGGCVSKKPVATPIPVNEAANKNECEVTGCSGQICSDKDVITTCEMLPIYDCYKNASCERQPDGKCDWTSTEELNKCLEKY